MHPIMKQALKPFAPKPVGATPGPWQIMNDYDGATIVIANLDGETFSDGSASYSHDFVCDTYGDGGDDSRSIEIARANAKLIASLPAMRTALEQCQKALAMMIAPDAIRQTTTINAFEQCTAAELAARKALASSPTPSAGKDRA